VRHADDPRGATVQALEQEARLDAEMPSTCDQPRPASRSAALPASYSSFCTVSGERLA
jgi:hypothetical protein